jgi:hemoglobin-like flavoprotein
MMLANTAVLNNHPRYRPIFEKYMDKFQGQKYAYWKAILRVARRILRNLRLLANGQRLWTPTG